MDLLRDLPAGVRVLVDGICDQVEEALWVTS